MESDIENFTKLPIQPKVVNLMINVNRSLAFFGVLLLTLVGMSTASVAQSLQGDTWSQASAAKKGTLTVTYVETPGLAYKTGNGQLAGVCVDIVKDFAAWVKESKGVDLNLRFVGDGSSFSDMYSSVQKGKGGVVGLGNITIKDSRKSEVSFSPAYMNSFAILVSQKSAPTLSSLDKISTEFAGYTAYVANNTLNETRMNNLKKKHFPALDIQAVESSPVAMEKLLNDPKAFSYLDISFYLDAVKNGKNLKRHAVGDEGSEEFGLIMPLGCDWAPLMQEFFTAKNYRQSTRYQKILHDHLGPAAVKLLKTAN